MEKKIAKNRKRKKKHPCKNNSEYILGLNVFLSNDKLFKIT